MPGRNLKLLCLDGGGVRGLSSLFILQKLMETINAEETPKPCEYFDIIGGTSTGGLIAIMLGRLEMDVQSCINWYIHLCHVIFSHKKTFPINWKGNVRARFESGSLVKAIKEVIVQQGFTEEELLRKPENHPCKVFVCATSGNTSTPVLFRSYPSKRDSSSLYRETKIWEAARATSAAPTFFDPIRIGSTRRTFGDGGTGANNPVNEMWKEATDICEGESLVENLDCIVSIGTGVPTLKKFGETAKEVVESIIRIATQTEEIANDFHHAHPELSAGHQRYFRFNAPRGLGEIELDEASGAGTIEDITAHYLRDENTYRQIQQCAKIIAERNSAHIVLPTTNLASPLIFSNVVRRPEWRTFLSKTTVSPHESHDVFERLSNYNYQRAYSRRANRKFENTTQWILKHPKFVTWVNGEGPRCLWLSGIVGCGKSIIMTTVIDATIAQAQSAGGAVLHFIYDHNFRLYLTANALFESYTKQLLGFIEQSKRSCPTTVVARILEFYGPDKRRPDVAELIEEILIPLCQVVQGVTFLVDGLDECSRQQTLDVFSGFRELLKFPWCRVFISCRDDVDVARAIKDSVLIWITPEHTKADMEIFLDEEINIRHYDRPISNNQAVLDYVRKELLNKAKGMFLWVQYQIKMLWEECAGEEAVDEAVYEILQKLPKDLNETYQRCLTKINCDSKRSSLADRILRWIGVATEPFKISQLQEALAIKPDTGEPGSSPLLKEEVITCCANLAFLEKDGPDELVLLAHHSVRQFLFPSVTESPYENAELELGELCVIHLYRYQPVLQLTKPHQRTLPMSGNVISTIGASVAPVFFRRRSPYRASVNVRLPTPTPRSASVTADGSFLCYATRNWALLTRNITTTSRCWEHFEALALLNSQSWDIYPWHQSDISYDSHVCALYRWSIINRHYSLLSLAVDQQANVQIDIFNLPLFDQVGKKNVLPLRAAAQAGDVRVVELLLKALARVITYYGDALFAACSNGHEAVVRLLLLTNKVDMKAKGISLGFAAENGHEGVVRLLLESKTDIEAKGIAGGTALHLAARGGYERVVQVLLENKADAEAKDPSGQTALHIAAFKGHKAVSRLLLKHMIGIEARVRYKWTALHLAAKEGHQAVVQLLLDRKANIEAKDQGGQTVLHGAAWFGHDGVVWLLLERNADIEAKENEGCTALHLAAIQGHAVVVQLLLSRKANTKAKNNDGRTAQDLAARHGHEAVVQLFKSSL